MRSEKGKTGKTGNGSGFFTGCRLLNPS